MDIYVTESTANSFETPGSSESQLYCAKDCEHFDEFVLDLSSLPSECDFLNLLENTTSEDSRSTDSHDIKGEYYSEKNCEAPYETDVGQSGTSCSSSSSSGYDSDSEEEFLTSTDKRRRVRRTKNRRDDTDRYSSEKYMSKGHKRKGSADDNLHLTYKRIKVSSPSDNCKSKTPYDCSSSDSDYSSSSSDSSSDSCSWSSSDSYTSSDSSSSSASSSSDSEDGSFLSYSYLNTLRRSIRCPDTCVCNAGQSKPLPPIQRRSNTAVPLYKKLLHRRLLSTANTAFNTCCKKECYLRWLRKRPRP